MSKLPRPSRRKNIVKSDSDENDDDCVDDINTDVDSELVDTDLEAVEEAYTASKAMGNTDCKLCLISL